MSHHAPPKSPGAMQSATAVQEPLFPTVTPEDRHAAVCAGAIKYLGELRAFARSLTSNGHQADDLVQSTILRALNAAQQFTPGTNFKAWSFTILRNVFYNDMRSPVSRHLALDDCITALPVVESTQDACLEFCDFRRAFAQLVPDHREALLLIGPSGLSYSEAAGVCNCAPGTMKSRVSRARAILREMLDNAALDLRRRDVTPISDMELTLALENSGVADNRRARRRARVKPARPAPECSREPSAISSAPARTV